MKEYDIIIIGTGMGGLVCGSILSREGLRVCMLEKNKQIGGSLQIFVRDKVIFDSGVHYLGGLEKGQTLYQIFKWLGILDKLKLERMDEGSFDRILIEGDSQEYPLAQGYPKFMSTLISSFPAEEKAIRAYCEKIKMVCARFPLYNLERGGSLEEKGEALTLSAKQYIESLTSDPILQAVLAGNNILYAGSGDDTPFYVHALVLNSYIESAWKCLDGGAMIGQWLARSIREHGGEIRTRSRVDKFITNQERVEAVQLEDGSLVHGKDFISNMHPNQTIDRIESPLIRSTYRRRLKSLPNTVSAFILNIVFKKEAFPYFKQNYYYHKKGHAWSMADYNEENWPLGYAIYLTASSRSQTFSEGMTVFTYMRYGEVMPWASSFNTTVEKNDRGESYEQFKDERSQKLLDCVEEKFPAIRQAIQSYSSSTPLSLRDYIGTDDGSLYGIAKDFREPFKTLIPPRTKLPNLYLTGQNLNLHGILGSALSGLLTCTAYLGNDAFIEKIKNA
ncbi:MAG: phytoene desaturase family protein [Chitinophagales bacterium]